MECLVWWSNPDYSNKNQLSFNEIPKVKQIKHIISHIQNKIQDNYKYAQYTNEENKTQSMPKILKLVWIKIKIQF